MKSIVIHAAKDLRVEERPVETPGPGEVQIRLAAGGICGSDLHYYNHGGFGTVRLREPMVLGHEVSGYVSALGEGVTHLREGQLVAISPSRPCGACKYCDEAMFNQCLNMRFYGSAMPFPHIQGAFREVLVAHAAQCAPADGLTAGEAAMAEPLAVCLHATKRAGPMLGKSVLVTGCGPIGILSILAARRAGVVEPNVVDVAQEIVWNYEGGVKLASGPVSGSLGVYYQVYDNFQVSVAQLDANGNPTGAFVTQSAGKASNLGVEAELAVDVTDWLNVFGNVGYIDGGIDEDGAFSPAFSGARFRLQPEWQASGGFTIDRDFGGVRFFATPTITHRSSIFFTVPNNPLLRQDAVTLVNARAGVSFADARYEIAGFIRNATGEDYLLDAGNTGNGFGIPTFIPGEPRFYGVEVTARF